MKYNLLDLFSGIGGFHKGLSQAGLEFNKTYFSEIDKHAIAIYKHNFKDANYAGAVESIRGNELRKSRDEKWIVTFGSPCQDLSLAGKRKGMGGSRSSLFFEATRIIRELKPDYFIWENVKGSFSSNGGIDFVAVLREIAKIGGYGCQWELCNTRWFLPQNRERIYLVGCLGGCSEREIFPIGEECRSINELQQKTSRKQQRFLSKIQESGKRNNGLFKNRGGREGRFNNIKVGTWRTHKDGQGFREVSELICPTTPARAREDGSGQPVIIQKSQDFRADGSLREFTDCPTLTCGGIGKNGDTQPLIKTDSIRRLTPIECERLQGFPDNWTRYGTYDGEVKQVSDTQRYKTLGNAVTVDVVESIGEKLKKTQ